VDQPATVLENFSKEEEAYYQGTTAAVWGPKHEQEENDSWVQYEKQEADGY
jgi:hypothetical protein